MKKQETGRSMVEMLGVLAIIGVLAAGGIAGYTMAMRKHRANEIVSTANTLAILAKSYNAGAGNNSFSLADADLTAPAGINMIADGTGTYATVKIVGLNDSNLNSAIGELIGNKLGGNSVINTGI